MKQPHCAQKTASNWISTGAALLALVAGIALAGCGGGGSDASTSNGSGGGGGGVASAVSDGAVDGATPAAAETTLPALAKVSLPQALFELSYPQVINTSYLSVASASATKATAAAASPAPTITPTELLNWAEATFPARFPAGAEEQTNGALTYRYYAATDVYLGVANNIIYAFGSDTANQLVNAGNLSEYACAVAPTRCQTPEVIVPKTAFSCLAGAITCVEVASTDTETQSSAPVTFGLPFAAGKWKHKETGLVARDQQGQMVPVQTDDVSSHADGSAQFAVVNTRLDNLQAGERRIVSFFPSAQSASPSKLPLDPAWNLEVQAKVYSPQITRIKLGNRNGATAGIPFVAGETITIKLTGLTDETFSTVVTSATAGGAWDTLSGLSSAIAQEINAKSTTYLAYKPNGSYENLYIKPRSLGAGAFSVSVSYAGTAKYTVTNSHEFKPAENWVLSAQDLLKAAITKANNNLQDTNRRFHGPIATEFHFSAPFKNETTGALHEHLTARLDTRLFESGKRIRTDVVIENNWAFKANPKNIFYELSIKQNNQVIFHQPAFEHYHHARWHKVVWTQPTKVVVRHHMQDFFDSKVVSNYNLLIDIPESVLAKEASDLASKRAAQAALGPMANIFITPSFGTTGARSDIGPLPRWTAMYLVSQDQRIRDVMMANADAAGSVPIHFRDENTDQPVDTIQYATFSTYSSSPSPLDPSIWDPDTSHQASFSYVPYLLTGDRFYRDESMFWASWNIFSQPSGYRGYASSLINQYQTRGQAWALRSIGEAFRVLPDSHTMKPYFKKILENNINWYHDYYIVTKKGSPLGAINHYSSTSTAPWQNDYFGIVLALIAENDVPNARELLNWLSQFTVGRFVAEEKGFCTERAPGYYWSFADTNGQAISDWGILFAINFTADVGKSCDTLNIDEGLPNGAVPSYHTSASGSAAYARGMLGAATNAGVVDAKEAYLRWKLMTPRMELDFINDPTWAIVPRP